jgi:hypothetical protein
VLSPIDVSMKLLRTADVGREVITNEVVGAGTAHRKQNPAF